jgi:aryl-alcohol dehydrogenase (NADP+)
VKYNLLKNTNLNVSEVCLGTMTFGQQNNEQQSHNIINESLNLGINFLDAAEMYPVPPKPTTQGRTEDIIGSWIKKNDRSKIILASKVTGPGRPFDWIRGGPKAIDKENIKVALHESLKRLNTDYIDLYQIHWPDRYVPNFGPSFYDISNKRDSTPFLDQLEGLDRYIKEGKIKYIGLSNETPYGVLSFEELSKKHGLPPMVSIQNAYNLMNRRYEYGLSEITDYTGIPLLAYSPLAFGHLTGKYLKNDNNEGSRLSVFPEFGARYDKPNVKLAVIEYNKLAKELGINLTKLSLAFCYSRRFIKSTIIGVTNVGQLNENIEALEFKITDEIETEIFKIYQKYTDPAP